MFVFCYLRLIERFQHRVNLPYEGVEENAVCCTGEHVFVVGQYQHCLFVYSWDSPAVQMLTMTELLTHRYLQELHEDPDRE